MSLKDVIDVISKIISSIILVIGAVFTYLKFFRHRMFKPRLELCCESKIQKNEKEFIIIVLNIVVKNVGLVKVNLPEGDKHIILYTGERVNPKNLSTGQLTRKTEVFRGSIFDKHLWIEPGEIISESIPIYHNRKKDDIVFIVDIEIYGKKVTWSDSKSISLSNIN